MVLFHWPSLFEVRKNWSIYGQGYLQLTHFGANQTQQKKCKSSILPLLVVYMCFIFYSMQHIFASLGWRHTCIWKNKRVSLYYLPRLFVKHKSQANNIDKKKHRIIEQKHISKKKGNYKLTTCPYIKYRIPRIVLTILSLKCDFLLNIFCVSIFSLCFRCTLAGL